MSSKASNSPYKPYIFSTPKENANSMASLLTEDGYIRGDVEIERANAFLENLSVDELKHLLEYAWEEMERAMEEFLKRPTDHWGTISDAPCQRSQDMRSLISEIIRLGNNEPEASLAITRTILGLNTRGLEYRKNQKHEYLKKQATAGAEHCSQDTAILFELYERLKSTGVYESLRRGSRPTRILGNQFLAAVKPSQFIAQYFKNKIEDAGKDAGEDSPNRERLARLDAKLALERFARDYPEIVEGNEDLYEMCTAKL